MGVSVSVVELDWLEMRFFDAPESGIECSYSVLPLVLCDEEGGLPIMLWKSWRYLAGVDNAIASQGG